MSDPRILDTAAYDAMHRQVAKAIAERDANFSTMSHAAITAVLRALADADWNGHVDGWDHGNLNQLADQVGREANHAN